MIHCQLAHVISPKRISPYYIQIVREIKINFKRLKISKNVYSDIIWTYLNVTPRDKLITWDPFWFCLFTPEIGSPCTWLTCLLSNALTLLSCKLKNFFQTPLKCIVSGITTYCQHEFICRSTNMCMT